MPMLRTLVGLVALAAIVAGFGRSQARRGAFADRPRRPARQRASRTRRRPMMGTLAAPAEPAIPEHGSATGRWAASCCSATAGSRASTAATVTAELQQAACTRGEPLLIAVDQEGGIVRRLAWAPPTEAPDQMTSPDVAHSQAAGAAAALHSVGIDIDFAPVVDTPGSAGNFDGSRVFSSSRTWNAQMAQRLRRRPADERDRGDREALPRPRPRERQHRPRADRDPGLRRRSSTRDCCRSRPR